MMGEPSLAGSRILILEDDYLLAYDAKDAFSRAGIEVVGPFSNEAEAIEAIHKGGLNAAITDVNLGSGPCFETARALRSARVPFILLTGYDPSSIPAEFADIPCIVKPFDTRQIVGAIARLLVRN